MAQTTVTLREEVTELTQRPHQSTLNGTLTAQVYRPNDGRQHAAVIVLHGCDGPGRFYYDWAKRLVSWGYVAIVPDSYGPRGRGNSCNMSAYDRVYPGTRMYDVVSAARWLDTQPDVRRGDYGVLGFSQGGEVVMWGIQGRMTWRRYGIKAAITYYPWCTPDRQRDIVIPTLLQMGEKDDWDPPELCKAIGKQPLLETHYFADAYHAFDVDIYGRGTHWVMGPGVGNKIHAHRIEYNENAAREAMANTRRFLQARLQ